MNYADLTSTKCTCFNVASVSLVLNGWQTNTLASLCIGKEIQTTSTKTRKGQRIGLNGRPNGRGRVTPTAVLFWVCYSGRFMREDAYHNVFRTHTEYMHQNRLVRYM